MRGWTFYFCSSRSRISRRTSSSGEGLGGFGAGAGAASFLRRKRPMGSYATLSGLSKLVLILDMLLGRLEIFPMMMLFAPNIWVTKRTQRI